MLLLPTVGEDTHIGIDAEYCLTWIANSMALIEPLVLPLPRHSETYSR